MHFPSQVDHPLNPRYLSRDSLSHYSRLGHFAAPSGLTSTVIYSVDGLSLSSSPGGCPLRNGPHDSRRPDVLPSQHGYSDVIWSYTSYIRHQRRSSCAPRITVEEGVFHVILYTRAVCRQGITHFMQVVSDLSMTSQKLRQVENYQMCIRDRNEGV